MSMAMELSEFTRLDRGPRLFDVWAWRRAVPTSLGDLPLELQTDMDVPPTEEMAAVATSLANFASANSALLRDLIFGHYAHAREQGWLSFWSVRDDVTLESILDIVDGVTLTVMDDLGAFVSVDPRWDPEHKLALRYSDGAIAEANDEPFTLDGGIMRPLRA